MDKTYTLDQVKAILDNFIEENALDLSMEFEQWLNDQWKNSNNWENQDYFSDFLDEYVENFIYWLQ